MHDSYWSSLVRKHGTTGYSDYSVSIFDQLMRIKVVDSIIDEYVEDVLSDMRMLDFGCGSGDFAAYFSNKFGNLVGYDLTEDIISIARNQYSHLNNVFFADSLDKIHGSFDVIISITVLQHILDDDELFKTVKYISNKCKGNGLFIMLESVESEKFELKSLPHLRLRKLEEWVNILNKSGFELLEEKSFYNPYLLKTNSFLNYEKKIKIFALIYRKLRILKLNIKLFNYIFRRQAQDILSKAENVDGIIDGESFSKIVICRKRSS